MPQAMNAPTIKVRALDGEPARLSMEILADMALRPTLDADELEREKSVVGQEIAEVSTPRASHVFEVGSDCDLRPERRSAARSWVR